MQMTHDLVRRLEAATGPSKELDYEISVIADFKGRRWKVSAKRQYTSSIDAALTLLTPDWEWSLDYNSGMAYGKIGDPKLYMEGEHKVPAIALCIASLRARMG